MRRWRRLPAVVVLAMLAALGGAGRAAAAEPVEPEPVLLVLFYGDGCPYCGAEREFLAGLQEEWPTLEVAAYEVWNDAENRDLFRAVAAEHGIEARSVPTTFLAGQVWVGFDDTVAEQIETAVAALAAGSAAPEAERTAVDVPFVGTVDVGDRSLAFATLLIGFVDGVNPCSLWVLSMLLALVLHSGSRLRILLVGSMFLLVTSALYGLYMVGAYSALDYAGEAVWLRVAVAVVAATFGVLHLKEHVTGRGPSLTIPEHRKPGMYRRMRSLATPERSLPTVLAGTATLAVGVSLVETPCTAGLPLLWTDLLAARDVPATGAVALFLLYLSAFLLDELVVFTLAVVTLRATKLQERHGRVLQLISGTLMLALALTMLAAPQLLESIGGTALVFAAAALFAAVVLAVEWWWGNRHDGGARRPVRSHA